ncbi:hypothetical protein OSB04_008265 [Centaurea solstitialis]|uniref:WRKY domain-containing protein n=1 Tax=Centaurea solstitialis TaxID=347529 RepID=A0AA38WRB5_9ASTR|nr:hypothetical protein OSB04_008265 [Centaurea solstitialis]
MVHGFTSLMVDQEDHENSPENSEEYSPSSGVFNDTKTTSTSSPKRSRRSIQKRVVSVPIKEIEGSRLKGETNAPPSDSWAWRKYGQKPIKGSPYPRSKKQSSFKLYFPAIQVHTLMARQNGDKERVIIDVVVQKDVQQENKSKEASGPYYGNGDVFMRTQPPLAGFSKHQQPPQLHRVTTTSRHAHNHRRSTTFQHR